MYNSETYIRLSNPNTKVIYSTCKIYLFTFRRRVKQQEQVRRYYITTKNRNINIYLLNRECFALPLNKSKLNINDIRGVWAYFSPRKVLLFLLLVEQALFRAYMLPLKMNDAVILMMIMRAWVFSWRYGKDLGTIAYEVVYDVLKQVQWFCA